MSNKDGYKKHKSSFLVSYFLRSKLRFEHKLSAHSVSILRYMADIMDLNNSQGKGMICQLSYDNIAYYSGSNNRTVKREIVKLLKYKILTKNIGKPRQPCSFSLGTRVTAALDWGHSGPSDSPDWGHSGPLYNNKAYNSSNNRPSVPDHNLVLLKTKERSETVSPLLKDFLKKKL